MKDLILAIFKSGISSVVNILLGIVKTKIMASILGPSGLGFISLLDQTTNTALTLANYGSGPALVQGVANRSGREQSLYISTAFKLLFGIGLLTALLLIFFAPTIARIFLDTAQAETVATIRWLAVVIQLMAMLSFSNGIINGHYAVGRLAVVVIVTTAIMTILAAPASYLIRAGYSTGYVIMVGISALAGCSISFFFVIRAGWLPSISDMFLSRPDLGSAKHLFRIARTTLATSFAATLALLLVRTFVSRSEFGFSGAGIFDSAWRVSMTYITLVLGSFGSYYMPRLSSLHVTKDRVTLMSDLFDISILLMIPLVTGVIVFKPYAIQFFYTGDFLPALEIMRWMLIGDYLKVTGWIIAMPVLAYADMKTFFWTDILWYSGLVSFAFLGVYFFSSLQVIGIGFTCLYGVYLIFYIQHALKHYSFKLSRKQLVLWVMGLCVIIFASLLTWNDQEVLVLKSSGLVTLAMIVSLVFALRNERKHILKLINVTLHWHREVS